MHRLTSQPRHPTQHPSSAVPAPRQTGAEGSCLGKRVVSTARLADLVASPADRIGLETPPLVRGRSGAC